MYVTWLLYWFEIQNLNISWFNLYYFLWIFSMKDAVLQNVPTRVTYIKTLCNKASKVTVFNLPKNSKNLIFYFLFTFLLHVRTFSYFLFVSYSFHIPLYLTPGFMIFLCIIPYLVLFFHKISMFHVPFLSTSISCLSLSWINVCITNKLRELIYYLFLSYSLCERKFFHFQKKLQVSDQPTLVNFLTFLKKNTSVGSSANFLSVGST